MRNYNIMLILVSLFVVRIIAFSGSYADAICLLGLLAYMVVKKALEMKQLESEVLVKVTTQEQQLKYLAEEMTKVKNSSEGLKAAINLTAKR